MKITFVRHAETDQNLLDICQGSKNNSLSESGRRKTLLKKGELLEKQYDVCYMSPMLRCVETAIILIGERVMTVPDSRLKERFLGEFEGMPRKFYDANKYWDYELNCSERDVEPIQDVFKRCEEFLEYIKEKHKGQSVMIVSHSSVIRALLTLVKDKNNPALLNNKDIPNLFIEEVEISD